MCILRGEIEGLGLIPNKIEGCEENVVTVGFFVVIENFSLEALLGRLQKVSCFLQFFSWL